MLIFDIETGPLDQITVLSLSPQFVPPPRPGAFDPGAVKLGNLKDEAKIAEKIEAAERAHDLAVASYDRDVAASQAAHVEEMMGRAALSAATGRVVAIGCWSATTKNVVVIGEPKLHSDPWPTEEDILDDWWRLFLNMVKQGRPLVGANIFGFDLPFLVRRSWVLGVDVPSGVRNGRYWSGKFIDIRDEWLLGQRWGDCESSLDHMARVLGVGSKSAAEGCDGATFARLWLSGDPEQRAKARAYLVNDLEMTRQVAERLGIV